MKKFKNLKTGCIEEVTNELLIEQYEMFDDMYELVESKKSEDKKENEKSNKKSEDKKENE